MWYSYFKIAWRNLFRQKAFSFINIFGLAIGLVCSILILLWVQDELSYDRFHTQADSIYRITSKVSNEEYAVINFALAEAMQAEMPEVKQFARLRGYGDNEFLFQIGERKFEEQGLFFADSTFLRLFSFPLVEGDPQVALSRLDGIVITERIAQKFFGSSKAVGKTIRINQTDNVTVMGVLQNLPANSHLRFDFLRPMSSLVRSDSTEIRNNAWGGFNFYAYVLLGSQAPSSAFLATLEQRMNKIMQKNHSGIPATFQLQPLSKIHLHSKLLVDVEGHGNMQYVRIFAMVAIFILLVACINFMNLATARSARRAKEVGVRKVIGAGRKQLVQQFLGESLLISFLALGLAVVLVRMALPAFNNLSGKNLAFNFSDGQLLLGLLLIGLLTGLVAGSYPALFLSEFKPVVVLKGGRTKGGSKSSFFRNGLVVLQFVVSIGLIVSTAIVYRQLQFMKSKNLGYDKENLLYLPLKGDLTKNLSVLQSELSQSTKISYFSVVSTLPTGQAYRDISVDWEGKDPNFQPIFSYMDVDEHFLEVFRMQLLAGRGFSKEIKTDTTNYMVNEKALQLMGLDPVSAVGKIIYKSGQKGTIIGVIKDFNFRAVQQPLEPLIIRYNPGYGNLVIRTNPGQLEPTINYLQHVWQQLNPTYPFTFGFIDQDLEKLYRAEQRMGRIFNAFAILAIFISCLGLYGLVAFTAEQRAKEIGIRKVLGASVISIMGLLSKNFVKLVLLASVIACPLAGWAMHRWLQDFAYRIDISWWIFGLAGITALLIALLTVSFQAVKAAVANPVEALRSE